MQSQLTVNDHSRESAGLKYVYPVVSRRSGGVSIGINLNTDNACNWRCVYCQVPNLKRGAAPVVDLGLLESELESLLQDVVKGNFFDRFQVADEQRQLRDIAFSGNGEPTSAEEFDRVVETVGRVARRWHLLKRVKLVLITNGSLIHRPRVQEGLRRLGALGGEVWFKVDSATVAGRRRLNNTTLAQRRLIENLRTAAALCPTWIQTCAFLFDGKAFPESEQQAYLALLGDLLAGGTRIEGVMLYGLARPSMQPEASRLAPLPRERLETLAEQIRKLGLVVRVSA